MSSTSGAATGPSSFGGFERALVTATVTMGAISTILTATIINVAIPDIMGAFGIGQDKAQWLSTGFLAANTCAMLLTDWMVRRIGQRSTYQLAILIFIVGSFIGGTATTMDALIVGRILQGASAGIIMPLSMLTMFQVFPPNERGKAMGIFGMGTILAPAIGPYIGGIAVDAFSWRYVFFLPVPFCVISAVLALFALKPRDRELPSKSFDWIGLALLVVFILALMIGLTSGPRDGWQSDTIVAHFIVAVAGFAAFLIWELWTPEPLLELRLFAQARFACASFVSFIFGMGLYSSIYLVPLFVQLIQGYTAAKSGLMQVPGGLAMALAFPFVGRLSDLGWTRSLMFGGFLLIALSSFLMVGAHTNTSFLIFMWWLFVNRMGTACVFPPLSAASLHVLPPSQVGQGSGAMNFVRTLGGAFGVNFVAILLEQRSAVYRESLIATQTEANSTTSAFLDMVKDMLGSAGLPETVQEPAALYYLGQTVMRQAEMLAFRDCFLALSILTLIAVVPAWLIRPKSGAHPA